MKRTRSLIVRTFDCILALQLVSCVEAAAPGGKTPADRAAFMERTRCEAEDDDKAIASVLGGSAIAEAKPLYANAGGTKGGPQPELRGVNIRVLAQPGMTAEWLDRALECHGARAVLGHVAAIESDPFWLPGAWVDIDVRSDKDGFEVAVTGYSPDEAKRIEERVNAFMKAKKAP